MDTLVTVEDKQLFAAMMENMGEKCMQSVITTKTEVGENGDWRLQYDSDPTSRDAARVFDYCNIKASSLGSQTACWPGVSILVSCDSSVLLQSDAVCFLTFGPSILHLSNKRQQPTFSTVF